LREVLNVEHKVEWGWPVALYLVTKGIAAGAAMIAPFFALFSTEVAWWLPETIALFFTLATVFLLVEDLKKPLHFYKLFTRPNWDSWLVKGGVVLTAFALLSASALLLGLTGQTGLVEPIRWANAAVAVLVAGYTAFLFKQCKGRDLWEASGLFWHLLAQSITAGAAFYLLVGLATPVSAWAVLFGAVAVAALHLLPPRPTDRTENYQQAQAFLVQSSSAMEGTWVVPLVALALLTLHRFASDLTLVSVFGAGIVLAYLLGYERAFVRAGQLPPLS
jgi:hypothetical protein